MMWVNQVRLPSGYQEVEYIQSSGTQYIDTGYIPSNNTKVELSMGSRNSIQTYCDLFGARYNWSSSGRGFQMGYNRNDSNYYAMFGKDYSGAYSQMNVFTFIDGNSHTLEMSQNGIYEDGTLKKSLDTVTFTSPVNLTIFALNGNGTIDSLSEYKLYYFKIWNSGTLVRDFVPCYRKSDNIIGLYDLVDSVFYTNSGTGTFTKGADVPDMVEKQVRPSGKHKTFNFDFYDTTGWTLSSNAVMQNGQFTSTNTNDAVGEYDTGGIGDANKITLEITSYGNTGSWTGGVWVFRWEGVDGSKSTGIWINYMTASGYNTSGLKFCQQAGYGTPYTITTTNKYGSGKNMVTKGEWDLVNKTATLIMDGTTIGTATLSDADIQNFRNADVSTFRIECNSRFNISNIKITIE